MSRRLMLAGNWKMNGLSQDTKVRIEALSALLTPINKEIDVVVCPPFTLIQYVGYLSVNTIIQVGGQDCHINHSGAHTGDISPVMLKDAGCSYVILGHSERRANHKENNESISKKMESAINAGLKVILCVGETLEEKQQGKTISVVQEQIKYSLAQNANFDNTIIAYEPVWAIGTSLTPTIEEISTTHKAIRVFIANLISAEMSEKTRILYGGSLNPSNASDILTVEDVDGGLIGGSSLKAEDFFSIIQHALHKNK